MSSEIEVAIGRAVYGTPQMRLKGVCGGREERRDWEICWRREGYETMRRRSM